MNAPQKVGNAFDTLATVCPLALAFSPSVRVGTQKQFSALTCRIAYFLAAASLSTRLFLLLFFFWHSGGAAEAAAATLGTQPQMHFNVKFLNKYLHNLQAALRLRLKGGRRGVEAGRRGRQAGGGGYTFHSFCFLHRHSNNAQPGELCVPGWRRRPGTPFASQP